MRRRTQRARPLLLGYLETVSSKVFEEYSREITALIGRQHGVYALYKGQRLYYVGLASNLRTRLSQHTKDKHKNKWDEFSIYLVRKADHIKELESLIMRVSAPAGNAARGTLRHAVDLKSKLKILLERRQRESLNLVLGEKRPSRTRRTEGTRSSQKARRTPPLAEYVRRGFAIRGTYKGQEYRATVRKTGIIVFRGVRYNSPSTAGIAARGRSTNGWTFWKYRDPSGAWVPITTLRRT